jgi:membrane-associated phospholipid phosphatase/tRNA A-37 threonylcarbamoyl transferase component Bud32
MLATLLLVVAAVAVFARGLHGPAVAVTVADDAVAHWLAGHRGGAFEPVLRALAALGSAWTIAITVWGTLLVLLVFKRIRHLLVVLLVVNLVGLVVMGVAAAAQRPRPFGTPIGASWGGWAMPSTNTALGAMALIAILYTCVPAGRARRVGKLVVAALVALLGIARVWLGADAPTDMLIGVVIGVSVPLICFRLLVPNEAFPVVWRRGSSAHLDVTGRRGGAILAAMREQLGVDAVELRPIGLAGSSGSTPLRVRLAGDPSGPGPHGGPPTYLFAKLYAKNHVRADRWYKLGRELRYGRLEDESPFASVRRLVAQEDYALSLMERAGLPSPRPVGIVEVVPGAEYLLVTEFVDGAVELGEAEVDDQVIDDALGIVRGLRKVGLAHRDIKPANLLVRDGRVFLVDVSFLENCASAWRQAVDLANMMLVLALRSDPRRVCERALRQFTVAEITEAFSASRGLTMPSQLRRMMRAAGRDLQAEFERLLPEPPTPVVMQRWSMRRVLLLCSAVLLVLLLLSDPSGLVRNELAETPLYGGDVGCTDLEAVWLVAQSVPSASLVPCVRLLPAGWTVAGATVNDGRATFTFDNDRIGMSFLVVRFSSTCALPAGATRTGVGASGVERFVWIETTPSFATTWYDRFAGGCVTRRLTARTAEFPILPDEVTSTVALIGRDVLDQALQGRSAGRLRLQPAEAP